MNKNITKLKHTFLVLYNEFLAMSKSKYRYGFLAEILYIKWKKCIYFNTDSLFYNLVIS